MFTQVFCSLWCWRQQVENVRNEGRVMQNGYEIPPLDFQHRWNRPPPWVVPNHMPEPPATYPSHLVDRYCPIHGRYGLSDVEASRGPGSSRNRGSRREDPRRHTLGGNQHLYVSPQDSGLGVHDNGAIERAVQWQMDVRAAAEAPSNADSNAVDRVCAVHRPRGTVLLIDAETQTYD